MIDEREKELRSVKSAHDLATLFRILPWIFLLNDKRDPKLLTKVAFDDARAFLESHISDLGRDRHSLMRGLTINWFQAMGVNFDPRHLNVVVGLVAQVVDETLDPLYVDGLKGESG